MGEQVYYLSGHLLVGETQIYYILNKGKEDHRSRQTACFWNLLEEAEANLIWKNRQIVIFEYL